MHRGEARAHQRDVMGERGEGCCQAKRGFWSSGPGACLSGNRSLGGKRVSATDMHQGAGGLGGSSQAPWPQRLRHMAYMTPPPSSQKEPLSALKISSESNPKALLSPTPGILGHNSSSRKGL